MDYIHLKIRKKWIKRHYKKLCGQFLKTYPQKQKKDIQSLCAGTWKEIKDSEKSYDVVLMDLQQKAADTIEC